MIKINRSRMNQFRPPAMQKQFSFAPQNDANTISSNEAKMKEKERKDSREIRESFGRQDSSESPHFPMNTRTRKSSNDSRNDKKEQGKKDLKLNLKQTIEEPSEK